MIIIGHNYYNHCKCGRRKKDISKVCAYCAIENKKLEIGHISIKYGYRFIKVRNHKWMTEHRFIVEKYIGRKLKSYEIVHHIDKNGLNNKLDNLYVFPNRITHTSFEMLLKYNMIKTDFLKSNLESLRKKNKAFTQ